MAKLACAHRALRSLSVGLAAGALSLTVVATAGVTPLTVYAAMGYDRPAVRAFTRATGIAVNLVHLSTGPLLARVQAEQARPQWDILWFDGNLPMHVLASEHQLSCGWSPHAAYTSQGRALQPRTRCYAPVGVTYAGVLLVNTRRLPMREWPRTWSSLASPALRAKIGMNNPAISGPTYPLVAGILESLGSRRGRRYFKRLAANGLKVFPTNSVTLRALQYGQIDVAIVQSSAALGFAQRTPGFKVIAAPPSAELPSDIAIGAHVSGRTLREARRFVRFVLSPAGQRVLQSGDRTGDSNYQPLLRGVRPPATLARLRGVHPLVLDPAKWGPREAQVVSWFTAHVAR